MTTFPTPENDDTKVRQAMVRVLTNQMNQQERHHRHNMASQEELAVQRGWRQNAPTRAITASFR